VVGVLNDFELEMIGVEGLEVMIFGSVRARVRVRVRGGLDIL
jgi:hypothetical protein